MADNICYSSVELTEADVPGATLPVSDPSDATVEQLHRWLTCRRGALTSGTKEELVKRVHDFIQGGLDKYILDPDHGANIRRKLETGSRMSDVTSDKSGKPNTSKDWQLDVGSTLKDQLGCSYAETFGIAGGGLVNKGQAYDTDKYGKVYVKVNLQTGVNAKLVFEGEMAGLHAIMATQTIRVPQPYKLVDYGRGGGAILVLKYTEMKEVGKHAAKLGEQIAKLHLHNINLGKEEKKGSNRIGSVDPVHIDKYGFDLPTCTGTMPTGNEWHDDWMTFFARQKIQHQIDAIAKDYGDRELLELWSQLQLVLPKFFKDLEIKPSLLHGDLTKINVSGDDEGPIAFDPACFYGHHEFDLSSVLLYGGFPKEFFTAYHSLIPKAPGYDQRERLYQVFGVLNVWNHFGSDYRQQALELMKSLLQ